MYFNIRFKSVHYCKKNGSPESLSVGRLVVCLKSTCIKLIAWQKYFVMLQWTTYNKHFHLGSWTHLNKVGWGSRRVDKAIELDADFILSCFQWGRSNMHHQLYESYNICIYKYILHTHTYNIEKSVRFPPPLVTPITHSPLFNFIMSRSDRFWYQTSSIRLNSIAMLITPTPIESTEEGWTLSPRQASWDGAELGSSAGWDRGPCRH